MEKEASKTLRVAAQEEMVKIRDRLKQYLPDSVTAYGVLEAEIRYVGLSKIRRATVFYAENSTLIVLVLDSPKGGSKILIPFWDLHKEDDEIIAAMLSTLPEFNWSEPFLSNTSPLTLVHKIEEMVLKGQIGVGALIPNQSFETAVVYALTANKVDIPKLPEGFELREIQQSDTKHLHDNWKYNITMSLDFYQYLLQIVPGCAIIQSQQFPDKNQTECESNERQKKIQSQDSASTPSNNAETLQPVVPVAWSHLSMYNSISNTFTLPEFRRRGLSKIVTSKMADQLVRESGRAFAFIEEDNEASIKLHEQLGFTKQCTVGWQYYRKKSYK